MRDRDPRPRVSGLPERVAVKKTDASALKTNQ
jgi:hypothetical protein